MINYKLDLFRTLFGVVVLFLLSTIFAMAQSGVADISRAVQGLGAYQAHFVVSSSDMIIKGGYQVDGQKFYLFMEGIELYGDGELRYQIDGSNRTVLIDSASSDGEAMLLDNPANAFDFASQHYRETLVSSVSNESTILLKANGVEDALVDNIILVVNEATHLPASINYVSDGDSITIYFTDITPLEGQVRRFSASNYSDYEIVDFR